MVRRIQIVWRRGRMASGRLMVIARSGSGLRDHAGFYTHVNGIVGPPNPCSTATVIWEIKQTVMRLITGVGIYTDRPIFFAVNTCYNGAHYTTIPQGIPDGRTIC